MRIALSLLLTLGLFLTPGTRFAFGLPCPCCPTQSETTAATKKAGCPCCESCAKKEDVKNKRVPPKPSAPCAPNCVEWCCGGGFVPLTVLAEAPALELMPDLASPFAPLPCPEGARFRLEDPPRILS